jgi:predicted nucleic acid-binding protein
MRGGTTSDCAGDSLHLAVAAAHAAILVTLDIRLADAAREIGVRVAEV